RDFFEFVFPGVVTMYWALFKVLGVHAWIPDALLIVAGLSLTWLVIHISRRLMTGAAALLPGLLFLTFPFRSLLDGTHHWYSTLAVMAGLAVIVDRRSGARLALAGGLCGIATGFTQARGPAAALAFAVFVLWESRQQGESPRSILGREAALSAGFVATTAACVGYFVWRAGFARFWFCTVTFVLKYYPSEPYNNWRAYLGGPPHFQPWFKPLEVVIWLSIHALVPLVYVLFFVRYGRGRKAQPAEPWDRLMLVNLVGCFLLLSVTPSPGYSRLCAVSPPALILLVWFVTRPGRLERLILRMAWVSVLVLAIVEPIVRQTHWRVDVDLPTGRTAYLDAGSFDRFHWILQRARPGEFLFGDTLVCFAMGLREPAEIPFVTASDYTRPEQVANVVSSLERNQVRWVIWYRGLDLPHAYSPGGGHVAPLRAYVHSHYHVAGFFGSGDQVWERNQ
ncbi:MAG TPA: hypothetical protein VKU44_07090, partial [Terriglobia bacterium]|nr:hypothetical protein [Terriglobia bacterium]